MVIQGEFTIMSNNSTSSFAFVILPKFSGMTISALVEPLRIANYCSGEDLYRWQYLSVEGGHIPSCSGMSVATEMLQSLENDPDTVIICGGWNAARYDKPELLKWLRLMARKGVTLGSAETGAYVLARAGLLSGHQATIHWHCKQALEESYPDIHLTEQLYHYDQKRMTCAGGTSGLDMMLKHIEQHHSRALALEVADQLLHAPLRSSDRAQLESAENLQAPIPLVLQQAIRIMEEHIEDPIKIPELTGRVGISQRKLERLFNRYFNCSAVAFYRIVRLQQARVLLTQTDMSVLDICIACGFTSSSYFSKSYTALFGVRPRDHRTDWPDSEASPSWPGLSTSTSHAARRYVEDMLPVSPA
jgi:transcriptional regulator GlxA family with amidase domain